MAQFSPPAISLRSSVVPLIQVGLRNPNLNHEPPVTLRSYTTLGDTIGFSATVSLRAL